MAQRKAVAKGSLAKGAARFEELGTIGEGSYGIVVKARDRKTGQFIALKKFFDTDLDETTGRELTALRRVHHSGVCQFVDAYKEAGKLRIAMEFVDGGTLLQLVDRHPKGLPMPTAKVRAAESVAGMWRVGRMVGCGGWGAGRFREFGAKITRLDGRIGTR